MSGDCLSFQAVPHVAELFRDYLYHFEKVQKFYALRPDDRPALRDHAAHLPRPKHLASVADTLRRQNRMFGASQAAFDNIERLRGGSVAAVTGQQVGLFGGPLYSVLKAVSAIRLARDLTRDGADCVPVFWLASEDHDLEEVNHVTLLNSEGLPERIATTSAGVAAAPMAEVCFGEEILPVVSQARRLLGDNETAEAVQQSYAPGETLATAFAKLFARVFAKYGLVLLDPADPELHQPACTMYAAAIENADVINAALLQRGRELREAGYHEQVKVTAESALLFEKRDGARTVVHRSNSGFSTGRRHLGAEEFLKQVQAAPQRFSPNVLLRPVVQDYLLPTAAYFAGPAEVAYFAQVAVVYEKLLGRAPVVLPRCSGTLFDARAQRIMTKYSLRLEDLFAGPEAVRAHIAGKLLPPRIGARFDESSAIATNVVRRLTGDLEKLDPTLARSGRRTERRILYEFERLRRRAANAELRRDSEVGRHAEWLSANVFPNQGLQEREIAGVSFLARYGLGLLDRLVDECGNCQGHRIVNL